MNLYASRSTCSRAWSHLELRFFHARFCTVAVLTTNGPCLYQTGQLYYFHWSTCKRAKQDPRELIRRADECVQAHLLLAHARSPDCIEHSYVQDAKPDTSSSDQSAESSSPALTSSECTGTGRCQKGDCESGDQVCSSGEQRKLEGSGCRGDDSSEAVMVALGCHSCAMFVMLSLSAPACPSCGAHLHPDHDSVR